MRNGSPVPQSDIRRLMADAGGANNTMDCNTLRYTVTSVQVEHKYGSLVDRGANGGLAGSDVRIITKTDRTIDVNGIDNHQVSNLPIVTAGGVATSQLGEVIVILNQYAGIPEGRTIHSSVQLEHFANMVDTKPQKVRGGKQSIETPDGYKFAL